MHKIGMNLNIAEICHYNDQPVECQHDEINTIQL
jgi:hypothetical protein